MRKLKIFFLIAAFSAIFAFHHRSCAQVVVAHSVLSGGGASSGNGIYGNTGTIGQPINRYVRHYFSYDKSRFLESNQLYYHYPLNNRTQGHCSACRLEYGESWIGYW